MAALQAKITDETILRPWGLMCADCDRLVTVEVGKKRRRTCPECGSDELQTVHITDCPICGNLLTDTDMADHLESHGVDQQ